MLHTNIKNKQPKGVKPYDLSNNIRNNRNQKRKQFTILVKLEGTPFQMKVWKELKKFHIEKLEVIKIW